MSCNLGFPEKESIPAISTSLLPGNPYNQQLSRASNKQRTFAPLLLPSGIVRFEVR